MVERIDPALVAGQSEQEVKRFIDSDYLIRSGMCPNGHGLMNVDEWGQECPACGFQCNKMPELTKQ